MYEVNERYDLFKSAKDCAAVAANRFTSHSWKWRTMPERRGHIPSYSEILQSLLRLQSAGASEIESGRLVFYDGRFGVQKPIQPHVLIQQPSISDVFDHPDR